MPSEKQVVLFEGFANVLAQITSIFTAQSAPPSLDMELAIRVEGAADNRQENQV